MGYRDMDWTATDRAHEEAGLEQDAFDAAVAAECGPWAKALRQNIVAGHLQTIDMVVEPFSDRISREGITELVIRTAISMGALAAGQLVLDMVQKCIDAQAEIEAIKEVEKRERVTA